jgi:hypothetical protein
MVRRVRPTTSPQTGVSANGLGFLMGRSRLQIWRGAIEQGGCSRRALREKPQQMGPMPTASAYIATIASPSHNCQRSFTFGVRPRPCAFNWSRRPIPRDAGEAAIQGGALVEDKRPVHVEAGNCRIFEPPRRLRNIATQPQLNDAFIGCNLAVPNVSTKRLHIRMGCANSAACG